ncbi:MBL fold metallo-hydrolase [Chloroflexota bacterium]
MQKIGDNIYFENGFHGCNVSFIVTKEGVVMIDAPMMPEDAIKWREEVTKHGPVRFLITTEPHMDHTVGSYFFDVDSIISHEGTREAILSSSPEQFKERLTHSDPVNLKLFEGFKFRIPNITLSQRMTIYLGDHSFQLIHMPGHSPYQVAVFVPEERVLFTTDNVFGKVQPWLHQALPYDWLEALKQIEQIDADVLVPGHGSICDKSYIPEMSAIIQDWIDAITTAINQGISLEEAQENISFLDRYPMESGSSDMGKQLQRMNVARLYQVLKH